MAVESQTIALRCSVCKSKNYFFRVNKKKKTDKLELKKYCSKCRKRTLHKQAKV
ncbi:MAG: 50S ribosomal protein L33 [Elusimicrobia bacterium CG08_land_8_20_14_0_20_44_26]|nr:MAG: 50S ribosomal protein L33 [Elusimicrobia bacterium CG08_land_8_20_14_0_20_44_26]